MSSSLETYLKLENVAYKTFQKSLPIDSPLQKPINRRRPWFKRIRALSEWFDAQKIEVPKEFFKPYKLTIQQRMDLNMAMKYQLRAYNVLLDFARISSFCPELVAANASPVDVINLSAGGCGAHEVLVHFNHGSTSTDYFPEEEKTRVGNSYIGIHDELGIDVMNLNGRQRPFALKDKSYDYVFCFQALDAYASAEEWDKPIEEMIRVARISVILVFNPPAPGQRESQEIVQQELFAKLKANGVRFSHTECPDTRLPAIRINV